MGETIRKEGIEKGAKQISDVTASFVLAPVLVGWAAYPKVA
jgi:hypothetical protein